jgi:hypothetical protein
MELANTVAGAISFNTNSATRGSISSAGVWRLNNLAGTGDRVVVASSNGTLSASTSVTGLVDTTTISTRAWRQKGDDSLGAIVATKGSGTVTSVATGYGLSGGTITTTGTLLVDTLNIATRAWRQKGLDSLAALEVSGSGTTNYVTKFTAAGTIGNSQIFDNGTNVGIGITPGTTNLGKSLSLNYFGNGLFSYATDNVYLNSNTYYNGDWKYANSAAASQYVQFGGAHLWYTAPSGTANNNVTLTERLRITSGGDVGIGGTPLDKFTIFQDQNATSTARVRNTDVGSSAYAQFVVNASGNSWGFRMGSSAANSNALDIVSDAVGTPASRLRIFANGRIGVNTTTDAGYQLDVNGTGRFAGALRAQGTIQATNGNDNNSGDFLGLLIGSSTGATARTASIIKNTSSPYDLTIRSQDNTATTTGSLIFLNGSTEHMRINSSGDVGINQASPSYKLDINGTLRSVNGANFATTSGNVGIGGASPQAKLDVYGAFRVSSATFNIPPSGAGIEYSFRPGDSTGYVLTFSRDYNSYRNQRYFALTHRFSTSNSELDALFINSNQETLINTTTDAGDYKLQVSGNARIGTGKLDISSNTAFSMNVQRSGTSEVAGTFNNSNGILYLGAESSTGGSLFTGSSAYAAVIGSGAAYPLQFATNNVTRATINTNGELLINTTTDNGDFKLQVNGNALISGSIKTANGASSTAQPWHLGSVVATNVQLDTANYVEVEINGTFYRLAIVTPL